MSGAACGNIRNVDKDFERMMVDIHMQSHPNVAEVLHAKYGGEHILSILI